MKTTLLITALLALTGCTHLDYDPVAYYEGRTKDLTITTQSNKDAALFAAMIRVQELGGTEAAFIAHHYPTGSMGWPEGWLVCRFTEADKVQFGQVVLFSRPDEQMLISHMAFGRDRDGLVTRGTTNMWTDQGRVTDANLKGVSVELITWRGARPSISLAAAKTEAGVIGGK